MAEIKGIDVSRHQGLIDWSKVKASGIKFAIIRAGYGVGTEDLYFTRNIEACIQHGIKVGVYWFMYCLDEADAIRNADKCHEVIGKYKNNISMKVWCDFEYDTENNAKKHNVTFTKATRTACIMTFIKRMESYGYDVGNYANPDYIKSKLNAIDRPLWLAQYSSKKSYDCYMWQYTSKGKVDGINGNVDMDTAYIVEPVQKTEYYSQGQFIQDVEHILGVATVREALAKTVTISKTTNKSHALVTPLERFMKSQGYYAGSIEADNGKTPYFGTGMETAIMVYQKEVVGNTGKNLDGVITARANTWKKLLGIT